MLNALNCLYTLLMMATASFKWIIFLILLHQWDLCSLSFWPKAPPVLHEQLQSSSQGRLASPALQKADHHPHHSQGWNLMFLSPLSCCCYCSECFLPCFSLSCLTKSSDMCWPHTANASSFYHTLVLTTDMIIRNRKPERSKCSVKTKICRCSAGKGNITAKSLAKFT